MASNDSDTESIISVQHDVPSDNQVDLQEGKVSDSSPTNDVTGFLQDLDSFSDMIEGDSEANSENGDPAFVPDHDYDICVDLDNLANDTRSPDDMYDILNKDPEWTQDILAIHVKQFTGPVGMNLGPEFDTSIATPLENFQLFWWLKFTLNPFPAVVKYICISFFVLCTNAKIPHSHFQLHQ